MGRADTLAGGTLPEGYERGTFEGINSKKRSSDIILQGLADADAGVSPMSQNEKEAMAQNVSTAARQQVGAAQREVARQAMAAGGSPFVGRAAELQRQMSDAGAEAAAAGMAEAENLNKQIFEARKRHYEALVNAKRKDRAQIEAAYSQTGLDFAGAAAAEILKEA